MITRLAGILSSLDGTTAIIDPGGGLHYEVLLPTYLAETAAALVGQRVSWTTLQYLESQNQGASFIPRLIAFSSPHDRNFFTLFTTVKGIGNRKALRALASPPAAIARAIAGRDVKALTQLPEIGKRMAETIIAELHGKVETYLAPGETADLNHSAEIKPQSPAVRDAVAALVALGESEADAQRLVARAGRDLPDADTDALLGAVLRAR